MIIVVDHKFINIKFRNIEGKNIVKGSVSITPIGYPPKDEFLAVQLLFKIE